MLPKVETQKNVRYERCTGHPDVRHVDCGGQVAIGGHGWLELADGIGFPDSGRNADKLVIHALRFQAYSGICLRCEWEGDFVRADVAPTARTRVPRGINARIKRAGATA